MKLVEVLQSFHKEQYIEVIEADTPLQYDNAKVLISYNCDLLYSGLIKDLKPKQLDKYLERQVVKQQSNYDVLDWHMLTIFIKRI